ncbi:achaete-scute homolog 5-like [Hypomesus transpacificus]|uniref:achaete-scute homolog 5-like n=1 Tax=Hypomesus transpacificus TaxID=137520 RepID=UPI001F0773F0|nr:achaete-scute homolog 5-like [Hypomesus transpacificus]XP_046881832.1 achaete-scute homolog 5-like [Hypomesus transpacificus]
MSAAFSFPFGDQHPLYLNRSSGLTYSLSPPDGHKQHRPLAPHLHHRYPGTDTLTHNIPFLLYPSSMDPASLSLYEGSLRGPGPGLLPYLPSFPHGRLGVYECPFEPAFIQKRNERERQRVKCVNQGYAKLREHLPGGNSEKRLSKVETLRAAIRYIHYLQGLVEGKGQVGHGASSVKMQDSRHSDGESPAHSLSGSCSGLDSESSGS